MTPSLMIGWMTQAMVVSALLAAAALLLQRLAGRALPVRTIWAGALFASLLLVLVAPLRTAPSSAPVATDVVALGRPTSNVSPAPTLDLQSMIGSIALSVSRAVSAPVSWSTATIGGPLDRAPRLAQHAITLLWPLSSALVLLAFGVSYRRHRAALRRATQQVINRTTVSVTDALGPAVIGVRDPRIVVPAWLLERTPHEQQLVVAHEQSHITARDPLLLLAACGAIVLMPWNPIAWFTLARLRLAIELDCDRRVLGTGASPRQYGQLLIELSSHVPQSLHGGIARTPLALTSPAFSYHASHLERRLITMTSRPSRFIRSRRLGSSLLAAVALLAACESQLPTAAELQHMDVKGVEARVAQVTKIDTANVVYFVDNKRVTRAEAKALAAENIATVNVRGGKAQEIRISTKGATPTARLNGAPATVVTLAGSAKKPFDGLLLIDGQKAESSTLNSLNPDSIESIEVMKGDAATAVYGEAGANGVIKVTTKKK
ncbi:M56 family metallopeptidase [Gemmatimonas sp.]|uniref:M56 family metallopeptidase n=1 Tax=Gemmatimonas sp. TaxID=1962908 RepID=UPI003983A6E2